MTLPPMLKEPIETSEEYAEAASAFFFAFAVVLLASPAVLATGNYKNRFHLLLSYLGILTWAGIVYAVAVILGVA